MKIEATMVAKGDRSSPDKMMGICYIYFYSRCHDARRVRFEWSPAVGQKPLDLYVWDPSLRNEHSLRKTKYFVNLPQGTLRVSWRRRICLDNLTARLT